MKGTIVEESLADKNVLHDLHIVKTWADEEGFILHDVVVRENQIEEIQEALADGPWYAHFWAGDDIVVIYKDKIFHIKKSDEETWKEAVEYGESAGIPSTELDFLTD
jgi:hypothetical protein